MSRCIKEIMNGELLAVAPETPVQEVRELLRTFAVSAVPVLSEDRHPLGLVTAGAVLDAGGAAADRMSRPAMCVEGSTGIEEAARCLAKANGHHLVVVDCAGVAVGIVSALDLLRGLLGVPVHHPAAFPHWDGATRSSWTDEWPLDHEHALQAPDAAGVLALVRERVGETDAVVWVEACANLRGRVVALMAVGSSAEPALARLLERRDLCFRAATVADEEDRERIRARLQGGIEHRARHGAN
jgi:hypothetical protein